MVESVMLERLERTIEKVVGLPIEKIRSMTLVELREYSERKGGKPVRVPGCLSQEDIDRQLDEVLKD